MRLVALVVVCGLIAGQDGGGAGAAVPGSEPRRSTGPAAAAPRRRSAAPPPDDPGLCFALRENEDQRQLLCNDRRSKFNFNPFGLRFGKRRGGPGGPGGPGDRRAARRAGTGRFSPLALLSRDLEVPT